MCNWLRQVADFLCLPPASSDHLSSLDKRLLLTMYLIVCVFPQLETICNDPIFRGYADLDHFSTQSAKPLREEMAFTIERSKLRTAGKPQHCHLSHIHQPLSPTFLKKKFSPIQICYSILWRLPWQIHVTSFLILRPAPNMRQQIKIR